MKRKITANAMLYLAGKREASGIKISKQKKYYRELKKAQWLNIDENTRMQQKKLYELVAFALSEVPYYRGLNLKVEEFHEDTIFEDIKKFPILTKEIIRREGKKLYSQNLAKDWVYSSTSGGTTGEPVPFRHCGKFFDYDQAGKLLYDEWCGRKIGDSQIRLWGSERDILSGKKDWMNKIYRWTRNEMFLNAFRMSDDIMEQFIVEINKRKPVMILAYAQSIRELAKYIEEKNIKIHSPKGIMTSAGVLDEYTYDLLQRVFRCPVLNRYGSREMGDMACSCSQGEGLHINMLATYLEILNEDGTPCDNEEVGNIIVTSLNDYSMPLIRYAIGDRGAFKEGVCSCGRGWKLLRSVNGRTVDVFKNSLGQIIDGEYFTHLFYSERNIKQFQIVQDRLNHIIIKLVPFDSSLVDEVFRQGINEKIYKVMGTETEIEYELYDNIPVTHSGKRAYTISLI